MSKCPVLNELETRGAYDPEYEQTPHLSGGDYDISAIRSCAEECKIRARAWGKAQHLRGIAMILGLAPGDTAEIDNTVRELIRSRDEWRTEAAKNAARIEELARENARLRKALTTLTDFVQTRVLDSGPDCDCDASGHICGWPAWQREVRFARAALEVQP